MHKYTFPWDINLIALAAAAGTIGVTSQLLLSIVTIQPWWGVLFGAVGFDLLCGFIASLKSRPFSFSVVQNRVVTNAMILAVSKCFYFLSESAHHFKDVHGALVDPIAEMYPFGDWVAWAGMVFIIRSIVAHAAICGFTLPFVADWLDKLSAQPPKLPEVPPREPNPARGGTLLG